MTELQVLQPKESLMKLLLSAGAPSPSQSEAQVRSVASRIQVTKRSSLMNTTTANILDEVGLLGYD